VLSAIELGDRTTPEKVEIQDKLKEKLAELDAFTSDLKKAGALACTPAATPTPGNSATPPPGSVATPTPTPTPTPVPATDTLFERWKATRHPAVYGALKTISVAYQSCSAGLSKALDGDTPSLKGISIVGTHSDGVGSKREISSLDQLISSQPYLQSYVKPANGTNCFDVRANPMIYDYGGKPYTTSDQESTFNLFKNAGSGTSVLGIDCSAYVYVSLASAGFKVKVSGRLKAIGASGISSSMYANPEGNGLTCLQHASFETTSSLKPGDIVAKSGHVFLIESVGADPFGIKGFTSVDQCKLSNMSISRFDFTILQSSSSKNGIGIHRAKASAYLQGNSMGTGLLSHAVNACKARFGSSTVVSKVSGLSVVRHSGSSDCRDTSIKIERESCVSSCKVP
ncbi:MAG TPA: hypothetical protein VM432_14090, partial [Bdellovibrionales bacterium]|nr:hypothetical protein [Bdellovibrionales bacterium]